MQHTFIKRLKKQKEDALEYIINEYLPFVKAIALKILAPIGKQNAVDECVNDVFLEVWQNAGKFQGEPGDFKRWIGTITKYKAIDYYRVLDKQNTREAMLEDRYEQPNSSSEQAILNREQKNEMLLHLSLLEQPDCDIFIMKYFLDMSNIEIADALSLTKAAVDNRLYRGKKKLAQSPKLKELFI
ncbi:sigma-70 family RNA polymerase sigma factor [Bacillus ndiopicus]|uniref:sigma-70 family RNA polymerase sigma factor n=1 Tax=Bacillus ndiopicus TaxID=1347368 RepID=UPI0005A84666|nr:sigma-70 family RNA polymerase sigma factor [Bacillus ndiopicus]